MRRTWFFSCTTILLSFLALSQLGCQDKTLTVGAVLPITGDASAYGKSISRGIEVAKEEILADATFGQPLVLTVKDSESNPERAKELVKELFDSGTIAAIGGVTAAEAQAMIEVADRFEKVLLSPSASLPALTGASRNFFRVYPSDFSAATKMATFAHENMEIEKVVVLAEEQAYAKGIQEIFAAEFERLEGEVEVVEYPQRTREFAALIQHAVDLEPEAIYLAAYADAIGMMIKELRKADYQGKIFTTSAFSTADAISKAGQEAAGVFLTQTVFELDSEFAHVKNFVEAFEAKYSEKPDLFAAHGYDAMMVLAEALRDNPTLPTDVHKSMRGIKDYPGVTGSIQFDERGDVQKFPRVYQVGEDLALYDYNERVQKQKEELLRKREEIAKKLQQLQDEARQLNN